MYIVNTDTFTHTNTPQTSRPGDSLRHKDLIKRNDLHPAPPAALLTRRGRLTPSTPDAPYCVIYMQAAALQAPAYIILIGA